MCSNWPYREETGEKKESSTSGRKYTTTQAVILGLGSLFNHSTYYQNVGWVRDVAHRLITYKTLRDIKVGEELCISYGDRLTFVDADAKMMESDDEEMTVLSKIDLA